MYLLKYGLLCPRVVLHVFISNRNVIPIDSHCPNSSRRNYFQFLFPLLFILHISPEHPALIYIHVCSPYTHTFILQGKKVMEEETITDANVHSICRIISEHFYWNFWSELDSIALQRHYSQKKLPVRISEDLIVHSLVCLERSRISYQSLF